MSVDGNQLHGSPAFSAEDVVAAPPTLRKELNLFDAVAIVVGTVIGSGIFLIPSFIAAQLHSLWAVLLVWVVGGILTVFGALSLAELGSIYPGTGGLCTYLRHAYGPLPAFLYAWGLLFMIHSGSIAGLAVAFGLFASQILPLSTVEEKVLSAAFILALTTLSCLGIRGGKLGAKPYRRGQNQRAGWNHLTDMHQRVASPPLFRSGRKYRWSRFFSYGIWYRIGCRAVGL